MSAKRIAKVHGVKPCERCETPVEYKRTTRRYCDDCNADLLRESWKASHLKNWRKNTYGITEEEWQAYLKAADYRCQSCGREDRPLVLDHCHETGKFRGVLCRLCNSGIGMLGDNLKGLQDAVAYLSRVW